jgi:hypothetical protein
MDPATKWVDSISSANSSPPALGFGLPSTQLNSYTVSGTVKL